VLCFDIFSGAVVCEDQQSEQVATEEKRIAAEENAYRLERRLALLQKERDSLKSLLDSYSAEVRWKGGVFVWVLQQSTGGSTIAGDGVV
jgi:hypothetical protein